MLAFEVSINDKVVCVAGVGDFGVLTTDLVFVRRRLDADLKSGNAELELSVRGLVEDEHLGWLKQELKIGDILSVRVIEAATVDQPTRRKRNNPKQDEERERAYYEHLKRKYEK